MVSVWYGVPPSLFLLAPEDASSHSLGLSVVTKVRHTCLDLGNLVKASSDGTQPESALVPSVGSLLWVRRWWPLSPSLPPSQVQCPNRISPKCQSLCGLGTASLAVDYITSSSPFLHLRPIPPPCVLWLSGITLAGNQCDVRISCGQTW